MRNMRFWSIMLLLLALTVSASAQEQVTINYAIAASPAELAAVEAQVALFEAANPDVKVVVTAYPEYETQLQAAFASGDYPDVFYVNQGTFAQYARAGVIAPAQDVIDMSGVYQSLQDTFTYEGTLYCPAKDFSLLALEYNKDMFDAAGIEYPTAEWTWADLSAAAAALTTDETVGFVVNPDMDRWLAFYLQAGGALYAEDGSLNWDVDAATAAAQAFADLFEAGVAKTSADLGAGWPGEAFGKAQAAMTIEGNWMIGYLLEQFPDVNWGVAEMPAGIDGAKGTLTFTVCLGVGADSPEAEQAAAFRLVDFLTNDEGSLQVAEQGFGPIPSRPAGADTYISYWVERFAETGTDAASFENYINGAAYAVAPILPADFGEVRDVINNGLNELVQGNITAEEFAEDVSEVIADLSE